MVNCEPVLSCVSFDLYYYINLTWFFNVKKEKKALAVAAWVAPHYLPWC